MKKIILIICLIMLCFCFIGCKSTYDDSIISWIGTGAIAGFLITTSVVTAK